MIIATIGNVKIKFKSIEDAAAAFAAIQKGEHVESEYQPFPMLDTYHPGGPIKLEIAVIDAEVVPRAEKQKEVA